MEKMRFFAAALALLSLFSCERSTEMIDESQVDNPDVVNDVKLVPMTFKANYDLSGDDETKTVLNGLAIEWKKGDVVAVFDDYDPTVAHEFIAQSDGSSTTLKGEVSENATKFFAVYPYSAANACTFYDGENPDPRGQVSINIPSIQHPVEGSFDPDAAVMVSYLTEDSFTFKLGFSLAEFEVTEDNIYSVSISSGKDMAGILGINWTKAGNLSVTNLTGTKYRNVTVKNDDNTPLTKGVKYYAVVRHRTGDNAYSDFTVSLGNTDCGYASVTAPSPVEFTRAQVRYLGDFSGLDYEVNRYIGYQDGLDVVIAGDVYNKATDGDAVEMRTDQTITSGRLSAKVHFLVSGEEYSNTSAVSISNDVVLASEDPDSRAIISMGNAFRFQSGSFTAEGISFVPQAANEQSYFFSNTGATETFGSISFANCFFNANNNPKISYIFSAPVNTYALRAITFDGCVIKSDGTLTGTINLNSGNGEANSIKTFSFTNNIVYNSEGGNKSLRLFVFTGSTITSGWDNTVNISNNIFYNVATNDAWYRNYDMKSFTCCNNLMYVSSGSLTANARVFNLGVSGFSSYSGSPATEDNYAFGAPGDDKTWELCASKFKTASFSNPTVLTGGDDPLSSFNLATGEFVLTDAFTSAHPGVGPQPMPAPLPAAI